MLIDCEVYYTPRIGAARMEEMCRDAGINKAVIVYWMDTNNPGNAKKFIASVKDNSFFTTCVWLDPNQGEAATAALEKAVREWDTHGLKLMPTMDKFSCVGNTAHPLMAKAEELGVPVTIHSGPYMAHPLEIGELALNFPNVPIIMDHMGYRYNVPAAIAAARRASNLYLATTAVMEHQHIRNAVKRLGAERVLFGSNAPNVYPDVQLLVIRHAEFDPEQEKKVLGENAARIYGIS